MHTEVAIYSNADDCDKYKSSHIATVLHITQSMSFLKVMQRH